MTKVLQFLIIVTHSMNAWKVVKLGRAGDEHSQAGAFLIKAVLKITWAANYMPLQVVLSIQPFVQKVNITEQKWYNWFLEL